MRNVFSWNLVIGGLLNGQQVDLAKEVFRQMSDRDIVSWTIMVSGFARVGRITEAREFFEEMPVKDVRAWNALMVGYMENQQADMAEVLFQTLPERDSDSWKHFINGLLCCQRVNDAVRYFIVMPQKCKKPWNLVLLGLIRSGHVEAAHGFLEKLPHHDVVSWTNVLVGYFGLGEVGSDATVWNVIICGLGENNHGEEGLKFFVRIKDLGPSPDAATFTSILIICSNLPASHLGGQIHAEMIKTCFDHDWWTKPTDEHYACLIDLLRRFGLIDEAMTFLNQMRADGIEVPISVWGALLGACRIHKNIALGEIAEMYLSVGRRTDA
ncbi:pentatricopeptide repeat-containing protein, putative [Ricinus communis]|uniref:Pentatricopeptide repeat-containing protein, putative n=1 Tax=Ricinus communis TaxID=3988 RepID=B9SQT3_RICCO|nr:pentatricopeptide repeat-containing protein, putative [Ricinus communis]